MNKKDVYKFCYYMARDNKKLDTSTVSDLLILLGFYGGENDLKAISDFIELMKNETELNYRCVGCDEPSKNDCYLYKHDRRHCQNWNGDIKGVK